MSVELSPASTLGFPRPLTQLVKRTLVVRNPNSEPVAFKVKTTAPKQYCVRPNSGRVEPGESVEVSVLLQPMREDPPPGAKCKDKFLVQSATIDAALENLALAEIWSSIETNRQRIAEQKIRCAFVDSDDDDEAVPHSPNETVDKSTLIDGSPNTHANGVSPDATQTQFHQADTTLPTSSPAPSPAAATSSTATSTAAAAARGVPAKPSAAVPVPASQLSPLGAQSTADTFSSSVTPAAASKPESRKADGLPPSEVDRLRAEVAQLKAQLASAASSSADGLRKRTTTGASGGEAKQDLASQAQAVVGGAAQQAGGGMPIEVVAALCVGVPPALHHSAMPSLPALVWDSPRNPYLAVGIPLVLGTASGYAVHGKQNNFWYNSLKAPAYNAPKEAYGIVWPILYAASGFGSYLVAQNLDVPGFNGSVNPSARNTAIEALNLYWLSLGLNLAWSPLFFGLKKPLLALVDIVALTGVVGALTAKAHTLPTIHNIPTSLFFAPYLAWLGYATYLNGAYYFQNYSLSGTRRTPKTL